MSTDTDIDRLIKEVERGELGNLFQLARLLIDSQRPFDPKLMDFLRAQAQQYRNDERQRLDNLVDLFSPPWSEVVKPLSQIEFRVDLPKGIIWIKYTDLDVQVSNAIAQQQFMLIHPANAIHLQAKEEFRDFRSDGDSSFWLSIAAENTGTQVHLYYRPRGIVFVDHYIPQRWVKTDQFSYLKKVSFDLKSEDAWIDKRAEWFMRVPPGKMNNIAEHIYGWPLVNVPEKYSLALPPPGHTAMLVRDRWKIGPSDNAYAYIVPLKTNKNP